MTEIVWVVGSGVSVPIQPLLAKQHWKQWMSAAQFLPSKQALSIALILVFVPVPFVPVQPAICVGRKGLR